MNTKRDLLIKVETLKNILVARATGQTSNTTPDYVELRNELIQNPEIRDHLPTFVVTCRSLQEFWEFIKSKFSTYSERRDYLRDEFAPVLRFLEFGTNIPSISHSVEDLFRYQFPAGLPFGLQKPNLAVIPEQGSQRMRYEDAPAIGIIRDGVYPDFNFERLQRMFEGKTINGKALLPALLVMSTTTAEKALFKAYMHRFQMLESRKVPVLIPQAWIQWHSLPKPNLRAISSSYTDDLYRVDFVAFWNMKRFAILVDDISHYAVRCSSRWDANEEAYSKRLKEDRKLRKEGWSVFRVSNWEMREAVFIEGILDDLQEFIAF